MYTVVSAGIISFVATYLLIPFFCSLAYRYNILDIPNTTIKKHKQPTPYLGGVALFAGFICCLAFVFPLNTQLLFFFVGITVLLIVGLIDDLFTITPFQKLLGQVCAAGSFFAAGLYAKEQFFFSSIFAVPFSVLWLLTIPNAFNLIDIMDGLATTVALTISCSLLLVALSQNALQIALLLAAFIGALVAFLLYNRPPAHLYLGDAGSLFIGGFLGVIPFFLSWSEYTPCGCVAPLLIFTIPLSEVGMLIVIRTYKGIPFYLGSRDHFAHYLQKKGWTTPGILIITALFSLICGLLSVALYYNSIQIFWYAGLVLACIFAWVLLVYKP